MTATTVIDSPEFVFHYHIDGVRILNREFMDYAETDLTNAAVKVLGRILTDEWNQRGYRMIPLRLRMFSRITEMDTLDDPVILPEATIADEVWDAAAARLEFDDIVTEAGLTRTYAAFVRAQPDYNY